MQIQHSGEGGFLGKGGGIGVLTQYPKSLRV